MKIQMLKILLPLALLCGASGCVHQATWVPLKTPIQSRTDQMLALDAREVSTDPKDCESFGKVVMLPNVQNIGKKEWILGYWAGLTFKYNNATSFLNTVCGLVANKYPRATVTLVDTRCKITAGLWMMDFDAFIVCDVEQDGGKVRFSATGRNVFGSIHEKNYPIAYERALHDLAAQINAAPADLSRVAK